MKLEHATWIVIADGEKFLLLRNAGDEKYINLEIVDHEADSNAAAHELSTDRPGRRYDATRDVTGRGRAWGKSAMEETDWHRVAEERFAKTVAANLREWASAGRFEKLVIIADPRTLGQLRNAYDDVLRSVILTEIDKDLTNLPLDKIESTIAAYDEG